jgi:hypothetical protein
MRLVSIPKISSLSWLKPTRLVRARSRPSRRRTTTSSRLLSYVSYATCLSVNCGSCAV